MLAEIWTEIWNLSQGHKLQWGIVITVFCVTSISVNTHILRCSQVTRRKKNGESERKKDGCWKKVNWKEVQACQSFYVHQLALSGSTVTQLLKNRFQVDVVKVFVDSLHLFSNGGALSHFFLNKTKIETHETLNMKIWTQNLTISVHSIQVIFFYCSLLAPSDFFSLFFFSRLNLFISLAPSQHPCGSDGWPTYLSDLSYHGLGE